MPIKELTKYVFTWVFYWIGDRLSALTEKLDKWRWPFWSISVCYRISSKFLWWSSELDEEEWCWLIRHEGETEEQFEQRCERRKESEKKP